MFTIDHTPHLKRPSVPNAKARLNLAAALHFLNTMMDRDPSLQEAQEDTKEMLMAPSLVGALAKDFMFAKSDLVDKEGSFFYEEERVTILTALQYYSNLIQDVGEHELMASLQAAPQFSAADAFRYHGVTIMNQKEIHRLFNDINRGTSIDSLSQMSRFQHKASRKVENPHEGITIDDSELDWLSSNTATATPGM